MIVSAVAMAGIATAIDPNAGIATAIDPNASIAATIDPNAGPSDRMLTTALAGNYECGHLAGYNHGYSFLFYCTTYSEIDVVELCSCIECCSVSYGGTNGGYYTCT
ncbi:hypothetical protein K503DRAFT_777726 [Rhizopogon vinicolor AM-OR11-026]|uniref:Uncharacterized protein n=1 Tax=Rhizopogon vinicolor AM-OR11-026 TaxID=1314800 RepID=A0A1B7MFA9_9AGAM|nr:hypothetical protein K503DRAFT_777726 [Rhizopogon vinicolor AM-OR11-026]